MNTIYRLFYAVVFFLFSSMSYAETVIHITGAQSGFPVAVPRLCDSGSAAEVAAKIPDLIARDLQISGLFKVLSQSSYVETAGKCGGPQGVAYSDWTIIGAEGLVRGEVGLQDGGSMRVELYLHDVTQQKVVVGKRYDASLEEASRIAHRFANEIMAYFTGEKGIFGTRIAYVGKSGRFKELFVMDLDGSNSRQITMDKGLALSPSWSPSGDKLVYTSYRTRQPEIYTISPDGGNPMRITNREGLEIGTKFMPNGNGFISSATISGISKIVLMDFKGKITRQISNSGSSIDVSPTVSPDGSQVAFCSDRAGGPQIYLASIGGGGAKRISFSQSNYCTSPAWSPKGDKLAFVCREGGFQIYLGAPDGSSAVRLTSVGSSEDPSWSPDGRFVVFSSTMWGTRSLGVVSLLGGQPTKISARATEDTQPAWSPSFE